MTSYAAWNESLSKHFLRPVSARPVYLALDDDIVEELWRETPELSEHGAATGLGAVDHLSHAVREDVLTRGWLPERTADCLARCCLFVLAYSRVAYRSTAGAPPYWTHVRDLLDPSYVGDALGPFGLNQDTFQELWARAREEFGIELPKPTVSDGRRWSGPRCNIAIVSSQAGLRQLDLTRVREMLAETRGRQCLPWSASDEEVYRWIQESEDRLRPYAQAVLARNPEVARRQIVREWEHHCLARGEVVEGRLSRSLRSGGVRTSDSHPLYLQLDTRKSRLLAYRGEELLTAGQFASEIKRIRWRVWIFDELHERFVRAPHAALGQRILLFVEQQALVGALESLSELSSSLRWWAPAELEGLFANWTLVECRHIQRPREGNPFSWILPTLEITGGLKLGERQWLFGAGPRVSVGAVAEITVDGERWLITAGGVCLSALLPGRHEVRWVAEVESFEILAAKRGPSGSHAPCWLWPASPGWPEITNGAPTLARTLEGPLFIDLPRAVIAPASKAESFDFPSTVRRRPTADFVQAAHSAPEPLTYAALRRGRK